MCLYEHAHDFFSLYFITQHVVQNGAVDTLSRCVIYLNGQDNLYLAALINNLKIHIYKYT